MKKTVYISEFDFQDQIVYLAATKKGLCYVSTPGESVESVKHWCIRNKSAIDFVENSPIMERYVLQFEEYLKGKRQAFDLPLDFKGTAFQDKVWRQLQQIPYGQTASYSKIAEKIGHPDAFRAVGTAVGKNPLLIVTPCHRAVRKNGTHTGYRGGLEMKRTLLKLEASCIYSS